MSKLSKLSSLFLLGLAWIEPSEALASSPEPEPESVELPNLEPVAESEPVAEPAPASGKTVRVIVDASALGDDREYFETEIAKRYTEDLTAEGFEVTESGESTIRVKLDYFDQRDRDFLIAVDVVHDGKMAVSQRPAKCPSCLDDELIDATVAMLPELVTALRTDPDQIPAETSDPPIVVDDDVPDETDPVAKPPLPFGWMGGVGIGVAALGVGSIVWGAVELNRGVVYASDPLALHRTGVDHTPRGKTLLGVGIAGVVAGGGLLVADIVLRRTRNADARASVTPLFFRACSPGGACGQFVGLGWSGRF